MRRLVGLVLATLVASCDAAEGETDATGGGIEAPSPSPSPCWTVGDWCSIPLGDAQCGDRMACRLLENSGSTSGVCVAPCSDESPCVVGKCNLKAGACMDDGVPVAPVQCG